MVLFCRPELANEKRVDFFVDSAIRTQKGIAEIRDRLSSGEPAKKRTERLPNALQPEVRDERASDVAYAGNRNLHCGAHSISAGVDLSFWSGDPLPLHALLRLPVELTQELHVRSDLQEEVVERRPFEG